MRYEKKQEHIAHMQGERSQLNNLNFYHKKLQKEELILK